MNVDGIEILWRIYHSPTQDEYRRIWAARMLLVMYEVCNAKDSQDLPLDDLDDLVRMLEQEEVEG